LAGYRRAVGVAYDVGGDSGSAHSALFAVAIGYQYYDSIRGGRDYIDLAAVDVVSARVGVDIACIATYYKLGLSALGIGYDYCSCCRKKDIRGKRYSKQDGLHSIRPPHKIGYCRLGSDDVQPAVDSCYRILLHMHLYNNSSADSLVCGVCKH